MKLDCDKYKYLAKQVARAQPLVEVNGAVNDIDKMFSMVWEAVNVLTLAECLVYFAREPDGSVDALA